MSTNIPLIMVIWVISDYVMISAPESTAVYTVMALTALIALIMQRIAYHAYKANRLGQAFFGLCLLQ